MNLLSTMFYCNINFTISMYSGYNKIPLSSNEWSISDVKKASKIKEWAVTEKVHGSCFCFVFECASNSITYAKRNKLISEDEHFFGFRTILPDILPKLNNCFHKIQSIEKNAMFIYIYGELFGGSYPTMPTPDGVNIVQSGIYYSPDLHFYAFDISIKEENVKEIYLDFCQSLKLFKEFDIFCAEPITIQPSKKLIYTSYHQALNSFDQTIGFNSTISKRLNLKEIPNNKAEGVVIRSMIGHYIVKAKIREFSESDANCVYDDNDYNPTNDKYSYIRLAKNHITKNRFKNASSKVGEYNEKNSEEIVELMVDDILYEINGFHIVGLREELVEMVKKAIGTFNVL
jgi:Rnl2 family RNA ligase